MTDQPDLSTDLPAVKLDILSDPVCPWCYIGKANLDRALERHPDHPFHVEWHPFQLNPDMPAEGMDRRPPRITTMAPARCAWWAPAWRERPWSAAGVRARACASGNTAWSG